MHFFHDHILSVILFTPLLGMFILLFIPGENKSAVRWWGNIAMFVSFLVSVPLVFRFTSEAPDQQFKFIEQYNWIPSIGAQYHLGIDGFSFLLIMLTTVLGYLAVLSSWSSIRERAKEYYAMFLLLQVGMLGVFMSLDFFLFYVFWEVMLVPMYFIIGVWGGPRKLYAAIKFFLYTLAGSVLMLLGILTLYFRYHTDTGVYTFNYLDLMKHAHSWPLTMQIWVFIAFAIGFAIKVPMFPFHTWLPDAHVEAPTAGSAILAAILLLAIFMMARSGTRRGLELMPWPDGLEYAAEAVNLDHGLGPVLHFGGYSYPPRYTEGYPMMLAVARVFIPGGVDRLYLATAAMGLGAIALLYYLAFTLFDRPSATVAALFLALSPVFVTYSTLVLSDVPTMLATVCAALALAVQMWGAFEETCRDLTHRGDVEALLDASASAARLSARNVGAAADLLAKVPRGPISSADWVAPYLTAAVL